MSPGRPLPVDGGRVPPLMELVRLVTAIRSGKVRARVPLVTAIPFDSVDDSMAKCSSGPSVYTVLLPASRRSIGVVLGLYVLLLEWPTE